MDKIFQRASSIPTVPRANVVSINIDLVFRSSLSDGCYSVFVYNFELQVMIILLVYNVILIYSFFDLIYDQEIFAKGTESIKCYT